MVTPWAFGHFLLRSQGIFALPVGKDSTQRSVQFSGAGSNYCFQSAGALPPKVDTQWLEGSYDPDYALYSKTLSTVGCPAGTFKYDPGQQDYFGNAVPTYTLETVYVRKPIGPCPVKVAGSKKASNAFASAKLTEAVPSFARSVLSALAGGPLMIHLDDHSGAAAMSFSSLYLSSTLAAGVSIGRTLTYVPAGPIRYAIREAHIERLLRHSEGPDQNRALGDMIYIADIEGAHGEPFVDDLPLIAGHHYVVFLQDADGLKGFGQQRVYRFTSPYISKMNAGLGGKLSLLNKYNSRMNTELRHLTLFSSAPIAADEAAPGVKDVDVLREMLRERGIASSSGIAAYKAALTANSRSVTRWAHSQSYSTRDVPYSW